MATFNSLKPGEVLSEFQYYKVAKIVGQEVELKNDDGESIVLDSGYVNTFLASANQFSSEEKLNMTEAAAKFISLSGIAIQVSFNKQVKKSDVQKEILDAYQNSTPKQFETTLGKALTKALEGEERIMTGRHFGELNELGRVNFIDMDIDKDPAKPFDNRLRQVDPRNINWFIAKGVKYIVK